MSIYTFKWPKGPQEVILTGTFDNWSKSLPLVKQSDGSYELTVPLPADFETNRILYKYIVDGEWLVSPTQRIAKDDAGIDNNVLEPSDLVGLEGKGSVIPESGLLATSIPKESAAVDGDVKTTVLPKSEGQGVSILGEPGIFVPSVPEQLAAFATVEDVDSRTLSAAEKKKQKKKVKRSQYKAKKKQAAQEAGAVGAGATGLTVTASTGTEETDSGVEDKSEDPATAAAVAAVSGHDDKETVVHVPVDKDTEEQSGVLTETVVPVVEDSGAEKAVAEPTTAEADAHKTLDPKQESKAPVDASILAPLAVAPVVASPVAEVTETPAKDVVITPATGPVDPEPTIVDEVPAGSGSATAAPVAEKEVDAAPIEKTTPGVIGDAGPGGVGEAAGTGNESDEEILIAQGSGNKDDIKAAIVAQEGKDVSVEEIKPTLSEAARLTQEANLSKKASGSKINKPTPAVKKDTTKETKTTTKDKKKPNGLVRFFKKIFD